MILDCSASDSVAAHYPAWLSAGIHVITPNKHAGAGPFERYAAIRAAATDGAARFRYEATVGAGLPIIQTLRDLLDTGDELLAVDGIFSGTLAWLFNRFDGTQPFSDLVRDAHTLGYTEPDPRDDLSGIDVARKLVILAREAGWTLSLQDVIIESLVPAELKDADARIVHGIVGANGRTDDATTDRRQKCRLRLALCRPPRSGRPRHGRLGESAARSRVRQHSAHGQHCAIFHKALLPTIRSSCRDRAQART